MNAQARQSECTWEIKMSFDHQSLSNSTQRGSQPSMSNGPHQVPAHPVAPQNNSQAPLVPCVYIALLCSHCGDLRQALAAPPDSEITVCPECARACAFVLLGSGPQKGFFRFMNCVPLRPPVGIATMTMPAMTHECAIRTIAPECSPVSTEMFRPNQGLALYP